MKLFYNRAEYFVYVKTSDRLFVQKVICLKITLCILHSVKIKWFEMTSYLLIGFSLRLCN